MTFRAPYIRQPVQPRIAAPQPYVRSLALTTIVAALPFNNANLQVPAAPPKLAAPQATPYNPNLFTNPIPFAQSDWNRPRSVVSAPPQAVPYNPNLFAPTATTPPFIPVDFSKPSPIRSAPPAPQVYPALLFATPFGPFDWNRPWPIRGSPPQAQPFNPNLFTNPIPFAQYDFGHVSPVDIVPPAPLAYNLSLYALPTATPFIPVDFPRAAAICRSPAPDFVYNPNLFSALVPFTPLDLSSSRRLGSAAAWAPAYNPNLYPPFTGPAPFFQSDWNLATRIRITPLPPQPYNVVLYAPVGPTNPLIQRTLTGVGL